VTELTLWQWLDLQVPAGMSLVLAITVLMLILILWNFHKDCNNRLDLKDLISHDGRISETKFMRMGAFVVSTWGFVYLILDERFSEWYFAGYMAAWTGNALLSKYLSIRDSHQNGNSKPPPPPQT
jgi:hypothetical protein